MVTRINSVGQTEKIHGETIQGITDEHSATGNGSTAYPTGGRNGEVERGFSADG